MEMTNFKKELMENLINTAKLYPDHDSFLADMLHCDDWIGDDFPDGNDRLENITAFISLAWNNTHE